MSSCQISMANMSLNRRKRARNGGQRKGGKEKCKGEGGMVWHGGRWVLARK